MFSNGEGSYFIWLNKAFIFFEEAAVKLIVGGKDSNE